MNVMGEITFSLPQAHARVLRDLFTAEPQMSDTSEPMISPAWIDSFIDQGL